MKRVVRVLFLILAISMVALSFGCPATPTTPTATTVQPTATATTAPAQVINLVFATAINAYWQPAYDYVAKRIPEASDGRIKVAYYPGSSLFTMEEMCNAIVAGATDFAFAGMLYFIPVSPVIGVAQQILMYENEAHYKAFWLSDVGLEIVGLLEKERGVKIVAYQDTTPQQGLPSDFPSHGQTSLFNSVKPITKLEDLKGLRTRIPTDKPVLDAFAKLGASVIYIPPADVPIALSQRMLDGLVATWGQNVKMWSLNKAAPYCLDLPTSCPSLTNLAVNLKSWNRLPPDLQQIMINAFTTDLDKGVDLKTTLAAPYLEGLSIYKGDPNTKINKLSAEEEARWRATVKPLWQEAADATKAAYGDLAQRALAKIEQLRPQFAGK